MRECLLDTPNLHVRRVPHPSPVCVVAFGNYQDGPIDPARPSFGELFLHQHGIDAIHVIGRGNDWYQYPDMPEAMAAVRAAAGGKRLLTYGSSMGGYAAIRFAGALGAAAAIAISPQYSLDRGAVPFEQRWAEEAARIRFLPWPEVAQPPPAIVFYDSRNPDALHAARWAAERPVVRVPIPFAGHPAGAYLAEIGLLVPAILDILADRFDPGALVREARARRGRSGSYLAALSAAQPQLRRGLKLRLMRMAVNAVPRSPVFASRLAVLLYRAGRDAEAEAMHRRALALAPGDPALLFRLSLFLVRLGRFGEALDPAAQAVAVHPASDPLQRHLRRVRTLAGPLTPLRLWRRTQDAALHRLIRLAWRRGWPLVGRLEGP